MKISRGLMPLELINNTKYLNGPEFLYEREYKPSPAQLDTMDKTLAVAYVSGLE